VYVCLCVPVPDRVVRAAIAQGARTLEELADRCGAGSVCGGCADELRVLLSEGGGLPASAGGERPTDRGTACREANGSSMR
jgi:bacterioferritin-associated ferredoxin